MTSRVATVSAAALFVVVGVTAPAHAANRSDKERVVDKVVLCAEELCNPQRLPETRILWSWTSHDATVERICGQHKAYTHTWRVAFCTGRMPASVSQGDYGDAVGGIADRGWHALGERIIGSGVWPS